MQALRPYPAYRESGVPWLGKVPAHWEVRRLRTVAEMRVSNVDKLTNENEYAVSLCNYTDVYNNDRIRAGMDFMKATATADEIERFRLRSGDVLITKDSEAWDDIGVPALVESTEDELISGYHLALLRPESKQILGAYLHYAISCAGVADQFHVGANGVTRFGLTQNAIKSVWLPLASLPEQAAIVRFLDHTDRHIRRYIRVKEKLIALLEEQRRAVIHQAVTGQIDVRTGRPYSSRKPSGVKWLGHVPAHWERRRLKSLLRPIDSRSITGEETLLSLRRDHGVVIYAEHFARPPQGSTHIGFKLVAVGHLVVNRLQANNGLVFRAGISGLVSPDYSVFEATQTFSMQYLSDLLRTVGYRAHFRQHAKGLGTGTSGFLRLYDDEFLATTVFLPPEQEQVSILRALAKNRVETLKRIKKQEGQLRFISEYRTRLIADVITGKLDVREAVAELPEEPGEPEGGDDGRSDRDRRTAVPTTQEETTP
ncbi:MAG: restriction endonuclease subunit S [Rhodospirillales bacterium]|nr:restriction endonuclease subunit S [Rhodospirillales bacterium]